MLIIHKSHYFAKSLEIVIIFSKLIKYKSKPAFVQHQAHTKVTRRCNKSINLSKNYTSNLNLLESSQQYISGFKEPKRNKIKLDATLQNSGHDPMCGD